MEKVILISIDGMRPDGFLACGNPYAEELQRISAHSLSARTVWPSVTLPCHLSLFHSVPPQRHGILTNTFVPFARPLPGLFEVVQQNYMHSAMFYGWEPLRDVSRPSSLRWADYIHSDSDPDTDVQLTDRCLWRIRRDKPDFVFLYLVQTDHFGHDCGWMSKEYLHAIDVALDCTKRVIEEFGDEYSIIITADHGGHDRDHGEDIPEDMTIPQFYIGRRFTPGKQLENLSILDTAPTIADLMGLRCPPEWEGKSRAE